MNDLITRALASTIDSRMRPEEMEIIYNWGKKYYKGGNTLEVGAYLGCVSYLFCGIIREFYDHVPESKHYIVDVFDDVEDTDWAYQPHPMETLVGNLTPDFDQWFK